MSCKEWNQCQPNAYALYIYIREKKKKGDYLL